MFDVRTIAGAAILAAAVAACGSSSPSTSTATQATSSATSAAAGSAGPNIGAATETVQATDALKFDPGSVSAHVGDIVKWSNTGTVMHTVTFDGKPSLSDVSLQPGGTWEVKFDAAGTYAYRCTIHPGMTGTVTVS
jgi:plastocyanin